MEILSKNIEKINKALMSVFILGTHEHSPIELGKRQVFFFNGHDSPQWPEPKIFWKKGKNIGKYKLHLPCLVPMHKN